jgi:hypothetical protein
VSIETRIETPPPSLRFLPGLVLRRMPLVSLDKLRANRGAIQAYRPAASRSPYLYLAALRHDCHRDEVGSEQGKHY